MIGGRLHENERVRVITDRVGSDLGFEGTIVAIDDNAFFYDILIDGERLGYDERVFARHELAAVTDYG